MQRKTLLRSNIVFLFKHGILINFKTPLKN